MPSYLARGQIDSDGNVPPTQRINLGCIGVGGRAKAVIPGACKGGYAKPVAFCDVDFRSRTIKETLEKHSEVPRFADFRVMLDKMGDDIDAVTVVTPDHTHFVAAMAAMQRGKHVYVEKPLTHSFREAELLMQAEEKFGVTTQMGNQGHTSAGSLQFERLVDKKIIRDIVKIEAWKSGGLWFMQREKRISQYPPAQGIPGSLNWDLWCGPAEKKPFNRLYHPFSWRCFYLYGNGMLGDWGAHIIDFAHEYLKLGLPTTIQAVQIDDPNDIIFPLNTHLAMHFPARGEGLPACDVIWRDGSDCSPTVDPQHWDEDGTGMKQAPRFGGAGTLLHRADNAFLVYRGSHGSPSRIMPKEQMLKHYEDLKASSPERDHVASFTQACLGNDTTRSPFRVSGLLTQVLMLGVICQYLNTDLEFDPDTKRFRGNDQANAMLDGPTPRKGWEEFYRAI